MHIIGLQIARFRPFVPAVNSDQWNLLRMGICKFFSHPQAFLKVLRCVVSNYGAGASPRTIVPTYTDVRVVLEFKGGIDSSPLLLYIFKDLQIVLIYIGEVCELVMCCATET
jgi:hypothetical protein